MLKELEKQRRKLKKNKKIYQKCKKKLKEKKKIMIIDY